ncbi:carbohydrate ABC transporter substrate-binding protein, CUT1 family [Vibrio xiamenensis]|uniref:Carbohydrate ABC transporter substrate-binding protein, CUT1 family n=1 Tax=Vibrio xiamenensis TaxID=861298 RepID=A0A1G7WML7_9VIBR|nr:extracellular solute-binding protein [Vibrio xiamenensis]SDG73154.1 carbohydrate ABC transporter substrate-binding protein, CUT1 family [Vibrio xiamenensis]
MKTYLSTLSLAIGCLVSATAVQAKTELNIQRFFGACEAEYGQSTDVSSASGECGIMTTLLNKFDKENPDIEVHVSTVEWPGYDQLTAQMASRTPPDVVTMHNSVISDYQSRNLIVPIDQFLAQEKIDKSTFTPTATNGVTRDGQFYGLPIDTWTMLFHINMDLMKQAKLVDDAGKPILPSSPDELLQQAEQFKKATGKPYFIQILSNETAAYARMFYTYMFQQNSHFFDDPSKVSLNTPEAKNIVNLFKQIYDQNLTTKNMDYPATVSAFSNAKGGILLNGNWLLGTYEEQSHQQSSPLYNNYQVAPYPYLFDGAKAHYVDGHSWVVPNQRRSDEKDAAIAKLFKFFADNDIEWSRTGHLPSVASVLKDPAFLSLPHREDILSITQTGRGLPAGVKRQWAVQDIIGEELAAAITGNKSVDDALADAEHRINDMLSNL